MKNLPKRPKLKYSTGNREVMSIRLPSALIKRLKKEVEETGYSQTEIVEYALDLFLQQSDKS